MYFFDEFIGLIEDISALAVHSKNKIPVLGNAIRVLDVKLKRD